MTAEQRRLFSSDTTNVEKPINRLPYIWLSAIFG